MTIEETVAKEKAAFRTDVATIGKPMPKGRIPDLTERLPAYTPLSFMDYTNLRDALQAANDSEVVRRKMNFLTPAGHAEIAQRGGLFDINERHYYFDSSALSASLGQLHPNDPYGRRGMINFEQGDEVEEYLKRVLLKDGDPMKTIRIDEQVGKTFFKGKLLGGEGFYVPESTLKANGISNPLEMIAKRCDIPEPVQIDTKDAKLGERETSKGQAL